MAEPPRDSGRPRTHGTGSGRGTACAMVLGVVLASAGAGAQVVRDGTLGAADPGPVASLPNAGGGTDFLVGESDGARLGPSLFHSLSQLDLASGDAAVFQGSAAIERVITRVTGGPSSIDGTLRSEIADADLFLLNPDGVVFGEEARLDVSGAFAVSTAHEVTLGAAGRFDTRAAGGDLLTSDPPERFGFVAPPAAITVAGSQLEGADERRLLFVGGELGFVGGRGDGQPALLSTRAGRIDLASVASAGDVAIEDTGAPVLRLAGVAARGDVLLANDFVLSSSGAGANPLAALPVPGSGPITVRARHLTVEDSEIRALTLTDRAAGDILLDLTGDLTVRGLPGQLRAFVNSGSDLTIPIPDGATLDALVPVDGIPGLELDLLFCVGQVRACGAIYRSGGDAGDIRIAARHVVLEGGGQLVSRSEFGGDAGRIDLDLSGDLRIAGSATGGARSGLFSSAEGSGDPGAIDVRAPAGTLALDDGGVIVIETGEGSSEESVPGRIVLEAAALSLAGNARIDSSTRGAGPGGDIVIDIAGTARLEGGSGDEFSGITTLSQPGSTGRSGTVDLRARDLAVLDGARIAARPDGPDARGDAGDIRIAVERDFRLRGGEVSTESAFAAGGNIEIDVGGLADWIDSQVTTSVTQGDAPGGSIRIDSRIVVLDGSEVVARADEGAGGEIRITTQALLRDDRSLVSASSNFGVDGIEVIDSPQGELNVQIPELPAPLVEAAALLREPCAARDPGAASSLLVEPDPGPGAADAELLPGWLTEPPPGEAARDGAEAPCAP